MNFGSKSKKLPELLLSSVINMEFDCAGNCVVVNDSGNQEDNCAHFERFGEVKKCGFRHRSRSLLDVNAVCDDSNMAPMTMRKRALSWCPKFEILENHFRSTGSLFQSEDHDKEDDGDDLEDLKHQIDPALLNGSSGNFGSAGARSAPSTPHGIVPGPQHPLLPQTQQGAYSGDVGAHPNISVSGVATSSHHSSSPPNAAGGISPPCSLPRSPSHHFFNKYDKGNIKQLSCSAPVMTAQAQSPEPPSPKAPSKDGSKHPTTSKARQKKFNRHFPAAVNDIVLNYYSCALIGDILLQGHLYITQNYFAFYSNVFGYVTKLLIPMISVKKISKEKTARIIPNAVGITTFEDKHVFGSLMSRDSTYKFMTEVWESAQELEQPCGEATVPSILQGPSDLSDSSETREESGRESVASDMASKFRKCGKQPESFSPNGKFISATDKLEKNGSANTSNIFKESYYKLATASKQSVLLFTTTFILILLFLSAAVLLYRIGKVQNRYTQALQDNFVLSESDDVYGELLQWQTHLHSKSAGAVHSFLDTNLDQIAKVRQSLEALSTLLIPSGHRSSQTAAKPIENPENS